MKRSGYMTRAMKARDPRYARVLGRLGYERTDMVPQDDVKTPPGGDLAALRKEYEAKVGKRPFMGWDADTLRAKITEAEG